MSAHPADLAALRSTLRRWSVAHEDATRRLTASRGRLDDAVRRACDGGISEVEAARTTGLDRETIRRIRGKNTRRHAMSNRALAAQLRVAVDRKLGADTPPEIVAMATDSPPADAGGEQVTVPPEE